MAANNYFGFTHGGTQYGTATPGAAYAGGQTGYAVAPAATAATYGTQRAAPGYDTAYQAAATQGTYAGAQAGTYQLAYGRTAAQGGYDANKSAYYQQAAAAAVATAAYPPSQPQGPTYDTVGGQQPKPTYTTQPTYAQNTAARTGQAKGVTSQYGGTYGGSTPSTAATVSYPVVTQSYAATPQHNTTAAPAKTATSSSSNTYSGYEAALYSAATMYVAQQTKAATVPQGGGGGATSVTTSGGGATVGGGGATSVTTSGGAGGGGGQSWQGGYKKQGGHQANNRLRTKQPPKPQQLHYCEVCRISCAGPQTYREHLEGQKHKKKEASMKLTNAAANTGRSAGNSLRCELCDVTCTGNDAYAAHVRGIKHQKVVKLHTRLGKPIPSQEPKVVGDKTVTGTAKINFVASGGLSTVKGGEGGGADGENGGESGGEGSEVIEAEVQPVGQEYIEEMKGDDGKVVSFNCKLCDCRFNDPNAKEMHMKGRRHRLQYKKKVQPDLVVDAKPSLRQRKMPGGQKMQRMMDDMWARRRHDMEEEERMFWEERRRGFGSDMMEWGGGGGGGDWWRRGGAGRGPLPPHHPPHPMGGAWGGRRESQEDRHMVGKHAQIYPPDEELEAIQRAVSHTEKALKLLSDALKDQANKAQLTKGGAAAGAKTPAPADSKASGAATPATASAGGAKAEKKDEEHKDNSSKEDGRDNQLFSFLQEGEGATRVLKGVMRVGLLAKGLLLKGDKNVRLVMLCADKPTMTLLKRVTQDLPAHLAKVGEDVKYRVEMCPAEGAINVTDGQISVMVSLTSPVMREPNDADTPKRDDKDVLPRQKCLDALASLRHAKWFQARAANLQSCVMTIRIMRDLCRRIPTWTPLSSWAMELLVEKSVSSAGVPLSPGDALRRLLEVVAGGLLLETGPGLYDPCEKEHIDAAGSLTPQMREDLTASAQQFLRQVAFKQIHKVLDMEPLPNNHWLSRKRRRSNTESEGEGKMVKTEGSDSKMDTSDGV